jgi:adenine C2-methylase RlmN of 23S rRNA A2503 and tRNA A37
MKIFRTTDNLVTKFIHDDGSETAIKTVKSIDNIKKDNILKSISVERNKYSFFISVSTGCEFSCGFCYLTMKNAQFKKLSKENILANLKEAILEEIKHKPELKDKYVKLSWMGMGDAFNKPEIVSYVTIALLDFLFENNLAKGLDGVDLSTIFPENYDEKSGKIYRELNLKLDDYPKNPKSFILDNVAQSNLKQYYNRSNFRLFYTIGASSETKRKNIIPDSKSLDFAINELKKITAGEINLIFHYMFIEGVNSTEKDVLEFLELVKKHNLKDYEIRILRYNFCDKSLYKEDLKFDDIIKKILPYIPKLKVQISAGSEVKAACGQFLVSLYK